MSEIGYCGWGFSPDVFSSSLVACGKLALRSCRKLGGICGWVSLACEQVGFVSSSSPCGAFCL